MFKNKMVGILSLISMMLLVSCTGFNQQNSTIQGLVKSKEAYEIGENKIKELDERTMTSILASNQMGLELVQEMAREHQDENLLLSPTSLALALAMVQNGAEGATKEGILDALDEKEEGLNDRYHLLMNYLNSLDPGDDSDTPGIQMKVANSLWFKKELNPEQDFVDALSFYYDAQVYRSDFNDEDTLDDMNLWVEEQTNHMLKDTIQQIDAQTIAYLMNTVYFKGTWIDEFNETATTPEDFYRNDNQSITTDMMHKTVLLPYYEDDLVQMTSIPYYGGSSMVLVLLKGNLEEVISTLDYETLQKMMDTGSNKYQRLELSLPKLDYEVSNNLNELLTQRGMEEAFSPEEAEFGKMIQIKGENVYISRIFQNARITSDEKGTEAAAVTVVEAECTSAEMPSEPIVFECNKPYIYIIKDDQTGAALFIGVVREP